ncbi:MAG: ppk [Firmicutes bacterium]|nr:ppk [Bacillota bacterium]
MKKFLAYCQYYRYRSGDDMGKVTGNFFNRELSWLKFNQRVMDEAADNKNPLLERLKFVAITSSNLDEFFMVRVAGLKHQLENGINHPDIAGLTVKEQLQAISEAAHEMVKKQYTYYKIILKKLARSGILFPDIHDLTKKEKEWLENYFVNTVYPVLTPMAVDASHPFPFVASRSLNLAVAIKRDGQEVQTAIIQVPSVLPRIIEVPGARQERCFVFLEAVIEEYCRFLFVGFSVKRVFPFRITRNADLFLDEHDADDLLAEVQKSLRRRKYGQEVRLEIAKTMNPVSKQFVFEALNLTEQDIYEVSGPLDLTCFMKFYDLEGKDDLRYPPITPQTPQDLLATGGKNLFAEIREREILLHHPYETFEPVVNFVQQAAVDPRVLAIKQTLYRVSGQSPIVKALAQAAENGKQVTVLVELKARFDEEKNIVWARSLEEAGCHVIYGLVGLKTHSKIVLVVRKEDEGIKRYVHLATGNYNDATAKFYTDMGLFTANDQFGADASAFFNLLSGYSDPPVWNKIAVAPLGLREKFNELIDREIQHVVAGGQGRIIAKMNSLVDKKIILRLYEAASIGVKIDLIVRGICVLKPGIPGVSENITVRSIVGRFLEHSRIFYFGNGTDEKVYLSSADWMFRNLEERVEILFPVEGAAHVERVKAYLQLMLQDNCKAHVLKNDGNYKPVVCRGSVINSQEILLKQAKEMAESLTPATKQKIQPCFAKDGIC